MQEELNLVDGIARTSRRSRKRTSTAGKRVLNRDVEGFYAEAHCAGSFITMAQRLPMSRIRGPIAIGFDDIGSAVKKTFCVM